MKHRAAFCLLFCLLFLAILSAPAEAQQNVIVRGKSTLLLSAEAAVQTACVLLDCSIIESVDGSLGQVFLVAPPPNIPLVTFIGQLTHELGIVDAEPDLLLHVMQQSLTAPNGLYDPTPVNYYGTSVWNGYANQPAVQIINLQTAQSSFAVTGAGVVAVIDTGVDPTQPVLQNVLVDGHDFTRNQDGGSETGDINQESMAVVDGAYPNQVNTSTMADVNQNGYSVFSQSQYAAFGHGTMVSGIIHLVAPTAQIMPLKAFHADGTGNLSDVLRAIYYATHNQAKVLNMSFDFSSYSRELDNALSYASRNGVISVASVGNDGQQVTVYPAGLSTVIGVASTSNNDTLSSFSNYGQPPVWVGAPGEGIVTTYPYGTYAAGWGTSFSAPLVTGTVALMLSMSPSLNEQSASHAMSNAVYISPALGYGRLDVNQAVGAWCHALQRC
jgi:subtilisin family serine protease